MNKIFSTLLLTSFLLSFFAAEHVVAQNGDAADATVPKSRTINLSKADFLEKVANYERDTVLWNYLGDKPAIIDFHASWCGPCKMMAPVLEELAAEYGQEIYIYKIDVDKEKELAALFAVRNLPSFLFIPIDGPLQMAMGVIPKPEMKKAIDEVLLKKKTAPDISDK